MAKRNFDAINRADTSERKKFSKVFNLEENYLMPSLQHLSMSKVAITLWYHADIKDQIVKYFSKWGYFSPYLSHRSSRGPQVDDFLQMVDKVLENLSQLALPTYAREMLSKIVHPIGNEIFIWIKYQDKYLFCNPERVEKNTAINYIDDLVWTPRGKIDYKETAKTLLRKRGILSDLYKYNIACAYSLEDDIAIIAPKIINTTLNLKCIYRQTMVYFWTAHTTGDFTKLNQAVNFYNSRHSTNYSANEYLLEVLIDNSLNEVAIRYIWDKLSHEEQSRQIVPAIAKTSSNDFRCFLLSQISKEQEKEVFKKDASGKILLYILGDWLWGHHFLPTLHNTWDLMHGYDYGYVLRGIVKKMESRHEGIAKHEEYKATFKEVWRWSPKHLKDNIFEKKDGYYGHTIFFNLFDKKNIDIIQLILFDLNDVQKKEIIISESGIYSWTFCFHNLITSNQYDLLEWLIERTLFCREDVERFKKSLIDTIGKKIAVHFILNKEWNKVQQFLKWASISDDDIRKFKLKLASTSEICLEFLKSIAETNNADFIELEYFFEWCASGNAERVTELKKNMLKRRNCFHSLICKLMQEDKYELLVQILNWCFVYDKKQVAQFKQSFYLDDQIYKIKDLIIHLIKQDDQLQSLKKFVNYCCATDEEINKFKTCILHLMTDAEGVCILIELLRRRWFKLADELLIWCCNSSKIQINNFINQLMFDDRINYILPLVGYDREVIRWFNRFITI